MSFIHHKSVVLFFLLLTMVLPFTAVAQGPLQMEWHDASTMPIQGKLDAVGTAPYERFPKKIENKVRHRVWELSRKSAGLYLDFQTVATSIIVRYQVEDDLAFPHMPATGVSGLDLYAHEDNEDWKWVRGIYSFKDTISYRFSDIEPLARKEPRNYRLYLPLYNTVKWLQIGIVENADFTAIDSSREKPIVVYGTSIVQGACASRPGMGWPNIMGRKLKRPIVNLGFSGNGRLEPEIIEFMTGTEASVYILDCMANFTSGQGLNVKQAKLRLKKSVYQIREEQPNTPILIVEHAGYSDGKVQPERLRTYSELNTATKISYNELVREKVPLIYLLRKENIGLGTESFVDGTHPNDHGMLQYANAYIKIIDEIEKK